MHAAFFLRKRQIKVKCLTENSTRYTLFSLIRKGLSMDKNKLEIRSFAEQPKIMDGRTVEGYAVVFGVRSQVMYDWLKGRKFVEVIEPNSITEEMLRRCDIRALIEHNNERLLARSNKGSGSLTLDIDEHGLLYRFEAPNTTHGNDIVEMINRGDIAGSSFAFRSKTENTEWKKESDGFWLRTVKLIDYIRDVTMTADPAYTQTDVSVRHIQDMEVPEEERSDDFYKVQLEILKRRI